jgi:hypothetical protein
VFSIRTVEAIFAVFSRYSVGPSTSCKEKKIKIYLTSVLCPLGLSDDPQFKLIRTDRVLNPGPLSRRPDKSHYTTKCHKNKIADIFSENQSQ